MSPHRKHLVVTKTNCLIEATYHLTLAEQRLLLLAIAQIDSRQELNAGIPHTVTADDLVNVFDLPRKQAYELLRDAAERLYGRSVIVHRPDTANPNKNFTMTRWVGTVQFEGSRGEVSLYFAPGILPFISHLRREFGQYQLIHVARMTSIYAIRLYELLIQWRSVGAREVPVEWLRERFDLKNKYANIRDLKRFVIEPAIEQINAHSDLWVKWEQHKRGRVVHALTFSFGAKTVQQADSATATPTPSKSTKQKQPTLTRAYIEQHAYPGESWEEATERCRRMLEQVLRDS